MKLDILLVTLTCVVKLVAGTINEDLLKVEEGGSGTDSNDMLINSFKKINGDGPKKSIDSDTESSGDDAVDTLTEVSGSGIGDDQDGSGSGDTSRRKLITTLSPTFEISRNQTNLTSHAVVVINFGTGAASTTPKVPTAKKDATPPRTEINNNVEGSETITPDVGDNSLPHAPHADPSSRGEADDDNESTGLTFTIAMIIGVVAGAILAILIILFLIYRLRKKDEGSYSLDEPSSAMLAAEPDTPPQKGKGEYYS